VTLAVTTICRSGLSGPHKGTVTRRAVSQLILLSVAAWPSPLRQVCWPPSYLDRPRSVRRPAQEGSLDWIRWSAGSSIVLLLLAAGFGVLSNRVRKYEELELRTIPQLYEDEENWLDAPAVGEEATARVRHAILEDVREKNGEKANLLHAALVCELLAIAVVAISVVSFLFS
jgi:hypothetical protein